MPLTDSIATPAQAEASTSVAVPARAAKHRPAPADTATVGLLQAAPDTAQTAETHADALLRLIPGEGPAPITAFKRPEDVRLPFFTLRQADIPTSARYTGTLRPYAFFADDAVTGLLMLCAFLVAWAVTSSHHFLRESVKNFFRPAPATDDNRERTAPELRGRFFAIMQLCFSFSILYYDYLHETRPAAELPESPYLTLAVTTAITLLYILLKLGLYGMINSIFFDRAKRRQWQDAYMLIILGAGLFMLPVTLLVVYFDLAFEKQYIAFFCIVGLSKLLLYYRYYRTFSGSVADCLHINLYFCALEVVPPLVLWRVLFWANTNLTEFL